MPASISIYPIRLTCEYGRRENVESTLLLSFTRFSYTFAHLLTAKRGCTRPGTIVYLDLNYRREKDALLGPRIANLFPTHHH